jgi:predicted permease
MRHKLMLLPLIPALLFFPSLRYHLLLDGADAMYYGLPLPWNSDSLAVSMAKDVYLVPLAVDILVACAVGVFLLRGVDRLPHWAKVSVTGLTWVWGTCSALALGLRVALEPYFQLWPHPGQFHVLEVALSFGV